jgi:ubiquinone/menaquinone biosynthesis C-methylase UbiE
MAWYKEMFATEDPLRSDKYGESEKSRAQVDFVIEKLALQPGARVLDLCCGQGRHLLDLMKRGYEVVGVDLSEYMLAKCREAAEGQGLKPNLMQADMREINFDSEFDAVINLFTSFGYLESDDEDQQVLDAVSRALKPEGRFFIDMMSRDWLMRNYKEHRWDENERGDITIHDSRFDSITGRTNVRELTLHADGSRTENHHSLRMYTYSELAEKLNRAGMVIRSAWGQYDGEEFGYLSMRMIVISEKART